MTNVSRRQLLAATGVGLGIATAGCSGAGSSEKRTVTVYLQPSESAQSRLQQKGQELQQELQTGNTTQQQARQEYSNLQSEIYSDLRETATTEAEALGLTVKDSVSVQGRPPTLLVSGPSNAIIDYVEVDVVTAVASSKRFKDIKQQQTPQPQTNQTGG
ncbi:MAG: hypothetical protein ABEH60_04030 [Halonotius sp.]